MTWVEHGDELFLLVAASTAPTNLTGYIFVEKVPGVPPAPTEVFIRGSDMAADRTLETGFSKVIAQSGIVVGASIGGNVPLKRGELYAMLVVNHRSIEGDDVICKGYVYNTNPVGMGEFTESVSGKGLAVSNEGATTLGNNDTVVRTITVPTNARWKVYGGVVLNGDDVTRNVLVDIDNGVTNQDLAIPLSRAVDASNFAGWPFGSETNTNSREPGGQAFPIPLIEGDRIRISFVAGGASAGGEARSSALIEEWIEI